MEPFPKLGAAWTNGNLVWGAWAGRGESIAQTSPCDGSLIQNATLLSGEELSQLFQPQAPLEISFNDIGNFALRLHSALEELRNELFKAVQRETGFIQRDCEELIEGSLAFNEQFIAEFGRVKSAPGAPIIYEANGQKRSINLIRVPWGTVAIILPQNAFLLVGLTAILNGLITGNRVILRAPLQSARSALLLAHALKNAGVPHDAVSVVLCKSKEFVTALCESSGPILLHYMGSSAHAPGILQQTFEAGKGAIADGAGNVWVFIDENQNPEQAAQILAEGATRYNGQTCTSINGAIIHPAIYESVRDLLCERLRVLQTGNPLQNDVHIGALFDARQAAWCASQMQESGGAMLVGGASDGNYLPASLVEKPNPESSLVREGLFGPALWIALGTRDDFIQLWPQNKYPLCAGVLSHSDKSWWLRYLPNAARIVFNGDTSIEHIFEPWGAYPGSGANAVSLWHEKYTRIVSVDEAI
jgi:acyl-CoA reductase-like NAD-dependent aldehyde dehydrogenase